MENKMAALTSWLWAILNEKEERTRFVSTTSSSSFSILMLSLLLFPVTLCFLTPFLLQPTCYGLMPTPSFLIKHIVALICRFNRIHRKSSCSREGWPITVKRKTLCPLRKQLQVSANRLVCLQGTGTCLKSNPVVLSFSLWNRHTALTPSGKLRQNFSRI